MPRANYADLNVHYYKRGDDLAAHLANPDNRTPSQALRAWADSLASDASRLHTLAEALDALDPRTFLALDGVCACAQICTSPSVILALADAGLVHPRQD